ncbi:hypothetical protein AWB72_04909 [Caballeronia concitans]|uniref:Uncharacterized protein n=1 Tax=Caballeronia concitans TaxID=1777133 RepID=A0A658R3L7_9BURK|nr:hypothetical protein BurMR1_1314 [Burkholderia sp. MR1]SAL46919.1 hypothetical protein AWB72_04909 [Caballeronia concitans]
MPWFDRFRVAEAVTRLNSAFLIHVVVHLLLEVSSLPGRRALQRGCNFFRAADELT